MPTVLSESDHLSLNSLSTRFSQRYQDRGFHHSFPGHFHPAYQGQIHPLPFDYSHASHSSRIAERRRSARLAKPPTSISTPTTRTQKKKSSIPKQRYNHGPKWIHRHGLVNGINYHWVETTNMNEDDGVKATDKPLVVLLHGFPQFWYTWRHQIVPLGEAGYRVVAPDLRGFNLTDKPMPSKRKSGSAKTSGEAAAEEVEDIAGYDMETLTSDIRALILHLGHSEANIVGHDWGGIIGWAFAARFPMHTTKLVVMNAPHLCRWRDVVMDYTSASCIQQAWWTFWYSLCGQLLPSWIPESVLSYQRGWILTQSMGSPASWGGPMSCAQNAVQDGFDCANAVPRTPKGFPVPGSGSGAGCSACWKPSDKDLYRDAISKPGAIHALMEYYRNLWLSVQQMEGYGKINADLPVLVLWGLKDTTFPHETYAQGWDKLVQSKDGQSPRDEHASPSVTVSYLKCGHFTPEEVPAEVTRKLLDFFQQPLPLLSAEF